MLTESTMMQDVVLWKAISRVLLDTYSEDFPDPRPFYDWEGHIGKPDCINLQNDFPARSPGGYKVTVENSLIYEPGDPNMPDRLGNTLIGRGPWWYEPGRIITWPYTYSGSEPGWTPIYTERSFVCPTLFNLQVGNWVHFREPNLWGYIFNSVGNVHALSQRLHNVHYNDRNAMVDDHKFVQSTVISPFGFNALKGGTSAGSAQYNGGDPGTVEFAPDPQWGPYTNSNAAWHIDEVRSGSVGAGDMANLVFRRAIQQFPPMKDWPHIKHPRVIKSPSQRKWFHNPFEADVWGQEPVKGMLAVVMSQSPAFYYDFFHDYPELRRISQELYVYEWTGFKWEARKDGHDWQIFPDVLDSTAGGFNKYYQSDPFGFRELSMPGMYWGYWFFNSLLQAAQRPKT